VPFSCLAYRAGVRRAFRLVLILLALLFSAGFYYLGRSNPLHVTLHCPVNEVRNRSLKRIGINALKRSPRRRREARGRDLLARADEPSNPRNKSSTGDYKSVATVVLCERLHRKPKKINMAMRAKDWAALGYAYCSAMGAMVVIGGAAETDQSTTDQDLTVQIQALKAAGCDVIRKEKASGTTTSASDRAAASNGPRMLRHRAPCRG
jgi:hypothetical protein